MGDHLAAPAQRDGLLTGESLWASAVVANCAMNRERGLDGVNSYARELGFNPLDYLLTKLGHRQPLSPSNPEPQAAAGWLDLCCGRGRALIAAGSMPNNAGLADRVHLVGIDLVEAFDRVPVNSAVRLHAIAAESWTPRERFDLITCVHGLHYIGDKLAVLTRAARWLSPHGLLVADLDLNSIQVEGGPQAPKRLRAWLRSAGFRYDGRRRRISCDATVSVPDLPYTYVGADDTVGPNYTHQPAVSSHYAEHSPC